MSVHPIHRRYYAEELVRRRRASERHRQVASQRRGRVDPNPHQIDAVMFALRRIPEGGCILADEVGLGKTIEAGLVIAQLLAEGFSRVLIVLPRPLLGQWQSELHDLFAIQAVEVADAATDLTAPGVFLAGREYAGGNAGFKRLAESPPFDLCLIDEAHEVFAGLHRRFDRHGVYDENSRHARTAHRVRKIIGPAPVLLLTATPIQNSLAELWALVQYVDPTGTLLGDKPVFENVFCKDADGRGVAAEQADELKSRLATVVQRTLRRQAQEFLDRPFVGRRAKLFEYAMSAEERALYDDVTDYLLEPDLYAFPGRSRQLLMLGFRRRMASSTVALAASLARVAERLQALLNGDDAQDDTTDYADLEDDPSDAEPAPVAESSGAGEPRNLAGIAAELARVRSFVQRANALPHDGKAESLVKAVRMVMDRPVVAQRKVVVFTESLATQDYLHKLLVTHTDLTDGDITLFRGDNTSERAGQALAVWQEEKGNSLPERLRPSPAVSVRLALVHEFSTRSVVFIATEAGAKGLNLQFCDTVVNYDLPWNPQRIEQRIGRCHRYGQQRDVTVINFLAKDNEAQRLTFEILSTKLDLFGQVLDMSDVVLHMPRSDRSDELASTLGPDFEVQMRRIWDRARSVQEVEEELRRLRDDLDERRNKLDDMRRRTVGLIERGLDKSVHDVFHRIKAELTPALAELDAQLERVLTAYLDAESVPWGTSERAGRRILHIGASRRLPAELAAGTSIVLGAADGMADVEQLHLGHPLITAAVREARSAGNTFRVRFDLVPDAPAALREHRGTRGRLALTRVAHEGFEREERLCVTAVFENAEVLRPAQAALALLKQPCTDIPPLDPPLAVTAEQLDEVVDEELFLDQCGVAGANQASFERTMNQLDQYMADRVLVRRRERERLAGRLAAAERERERAPGADPRERARRRVGEFEAQIETLDRQIDQLVTRDDEVYERWRTHAHRRRYSPPCGERLLAAEFVVA